MFKSVKSRQMEGVPLGAYVIELIGEPEVPIFRDNKIYDKITFYMTFTDTELSGKTPAELVRFFSMCLENGLEALGDLYLQMHDLPPFSDDEAANEAWRRANA